MSDPALTDLPELPTPHEIVFTEEDKTYVRACAARVADALRERTSSTVILAFAGATEGALELLRRLGDKARWHVYPHAADADGAPQLRFERPR